MAANETFTIESPIDGHVVAERPVADAAEVDAALQKAHDAFGPWKRTPLDERIAVCERFVDALVTGRDDLGRELTTMMGRPIRYTPNEVSTAGERARAMIELARESLQDIPVEDNADFRKYIKREPLGPVLCVPAWNYPYLIATNAVVPAILAGNSVVLKHSAQTALCAERFDAAFEKAGLPHGVHNVLHTSHALTEKAVGDARVAHVAFTGSVRGGHAMMNAAKDRFVACGLELGGKDPAYVRADCDFDATVENLVDGAFFNSGQSCCGIERIYVDAAVYERFVEAFVAATRAYNVGDPLDGETLLGPLAKPGHADFVRSEIETAVKAGARAHIDAAQFALADRPKQYLAPQVLTDVTHEMSIMTEETFGPVVGIMKVGSEAEAIRLMNDSPYGLTASIWTSDEDAALRVGEQVDTGTWFMNRCDYLDPKLAWVGVKDTGRGTTLSSVGFEYLTRAKSYHLRRRFS